MIIPLRTLDLTVLDSVTKQPIEGAVVSHFLTHWPPGKTGNPERTGSNGTVAILVPKTVPGLERMDQYPVEVRASNYAQREVLWLSTTGGVLSMVSTQYTLGLEHGITLGGAVLDAAGQPIAGVRVGMMGNNYRGHSDQAEARIDQVAQFWSVISTNDPAADGIVTDGQGRFQVSHFPMDLRALQIELLAPDGARRKFRTPQGKWLSTEEMPEVAFEDLRSGMARLVFPAGINVEGVVVDSADRPIRDAQVVEGIIVCVEQDRPGIAVVPAFQ